MKNFSKVMDQLSRRYELHNVFDDFMQLTVYALTLGRKEEEYKQLISRYEPEEAKLFAQAFGALTKDYEEVSCAAGSWGDVLGTYFETINSKSTASNRGQFFTPVHLCNLMAQLTEEGKVKANISDPTCGSARNLIAHARLKSENRFECFYYGSDLDNRCVNMSVINMFMYGMKGAVVHMNALSLETWKGYRIYLPETGLGVMPLNEAQCRRYVLN